MRDTKIRLYIEQPIQAGQEIPLTKDQANYLFAVMRLSVGDTLEVFDGKNGGWQTEVLQASKRAGTIKPLREIRPQVSPPDLWLLFSPIKKARTDFIVEKAAEMGVRAIFPMRTQFTNSERIRQDRLQAHAVEAAEQCGGTFVPEVHDIQTLEALLKDWPTDRQLIFCDEAQVGEPTGLTGLQSKAAIVIGPEGGFSESERAKLSAHPKAHVLSLGPRILRADTAAVAAMALWQLQAGDWT